MPDERAGAWERWPALFERASGLVYVNADRQKWDAVARSWDGSGPPVAGSRAFLGRVTHEMYHYLQFFACGYLTSICAEHFEAVRRAMILPLDQAKLDAFLATPQLRPARLNEIEMHLARPGTDGLSALQILEGCARLFQARQEQPNLLHGAHILNMKRTPDPNLYGRFYEKVTAKLGARALDETLFLGATALEYVDPPAAAFMLLHLRAEGKGAFGSTDLHEAHAALTEDLLGFGYCRLGSAAELAQAGRTRHPLLEEAWPYHGSKNWTRNIRDAVWGRRGTVFLDFLHHAEIMLNDVIWTAPGKNEERRTAVVVRYHIARLSRHLSGSRMETGDV